MKPLLNLIIPYTGHKMEGVSTAECSTLEIEQSLLIQFLLSHMMFIVSEINYILMFMQTLIQT